MLCIRTTSCSANRTRPKDASLKLFPSSCVSHALESFFGKCSVRRSQITPLVLLVLETVLHPAWHQAWMDALQKRGTRAGDDPSQNRNLVPPPSQCGALRRARQQRCASWDSRTRGAFAAPRWQPCAEGPLVLLPMRWRLPATARRRGRGQNSSRRFSSLG